MILIIRPHPVFSLSWAYCDRRDTLYILLYYVYLHISVCITQNTVTQFGASSRGNIQVLESSVDGIQIRSAIPFTAPEFELSCYWHGVRDYSLWSSL